MSDSVLLLKSNKNGYGTTKVTCEIYPTNLCHVGLELKTSRLEDEHSTDREGELIRK